MLIPVPQRDGAGLRRSLSCSLLWVQLQLRTVEPIVLVVAGRALPPKKA